MSINVPPNAKERSKALDLALQQIEKQFGKGAIMKLGEGNTVPEIETLIREAGFTPAQRTTLYEIVREAPGPEALESHQRIGARFRHCHSWLRGGALLTRAHVVILSRADGEGPHS